METRKKTNKPIGDAVVPLKLSRKKKKTKPVKVKHVVKKKKKKEYTFFNCTMCSKQFTDKYLLSSHMDTHSTDLPYACSECPSHYKTKKYLSRHVKRMHRPATQYECDFCGKMFHYRSKMLQHKRVHTGEKPYKCTQCGKAFNARYSLSTHMFIHTNEKPFSCSFCPYACRDSSTLRKHQHRHMGLVKEYHCKMCHRKYTVKSQLKTHVAEQHLALDVRKHVCECGKRFLQKAHLNKHIQTVHLRLFAAECDVCGRRVSDRANLAAHLRTHVDARPFACTFGGCDKRYKDMSSLLKHSRVHYPEQQAACEQCGKMFTREERRRRHQAFCRRTRVKEVECGHCGVRFYNKTYLLTHIRRKHMGKKKKYICDICRFVTYNKPSIVMHIKHGHASESDRVCTICKKTFKRHIYLKAHYWRTHFIRYKIRRCSKKRLQIKEEPESELDEQSIHLFEIEKEEPLDDRDLDQMETNADLKESSTDIKESNTDLNQPDTGLKELNIEFDNPGIHLKEPNTDLNEPDTDQKEPNTDLKEPNTDFNEPDTVLKEPKSDLNELNTELIEPITALKETNTALEEINTDLKETNTDLEETNTDLKETNTDLEETNTDLKETNTDLKETNTDLKESNTDLTLFQIEGAKEARRLIARNRKHLKDVPEAVFDEFYIQHVHRKHFHEKEPRKTKTKEYLDVEMEAYAKECVNRMLVEARHREEARALERTRQVYNERMRVALSGLQKKENVKIKYFNYNNKTINETLERDQSFDARMKHKKTNNDKNDDEESLEGDNELLGDITGTETLEVQKHSKNSDKETINDGKQTQKDDEEPINDDKETHKDDKKPLNNSKNKICYKNSKGQQNDDNKSQPDEKQSQNDNNDPLDDVKESSDEANDDPADSDYIDEENEVKEKTEIKGRNKKVNFNSHECFVCFKLYETKEKLIDHCKDHFDVCNKTFLKKCPLCDYVTKLNLRRHMRLVHKLHIDIPWAGIKDKVENSGGSRYYIDVKNSVVDKIEVIPSVQNLNKIASTKIDKKNRNDKDKIVAKTKLVKKCGGWVVENETIDVKLDDFVLPAFEVDEKKTTVNIYKKNDNYIDRMKKLYHMAKKNGKKMLFPCESCEKICQTVAALKLHNRKHDPNAKPFKKKVWKHKSKEIPVKKAIKIDTNNRDAKPKPIVHKHKCDPELIEFYEKNIRGGDIEFWQFLKIYNRMGRENIKDFGDLDGRIDFGVHTAKPKVIEDTEMTKTNTKPKTTKTKARKVKATQNAYKRFIRISKKDHVRRNAIKNELRKRMDGEKEAQMSMNEIETLEKQELST